MTPGPDNDTTLKLLLAALGLATLASLASSILALTSGG